MDPVQVKKNRYKKILEISPSLILSMLLHCAIFIAFFYSRNTSKDQEKKERPQPTIIKISLNYKRSIYKNEILKIEQKEIKNGRQIFSSTKNIPKTLSLKNTNKSSTSLTDIENLTINSRLKNPKQEIPKTSQSDSKPKESVTLINPFGFLKLPRLLLGQNLFPRKYKVDFKLKEKNFKIIGFYLKNLSAIQEQQPYLDKTIQKAFESQIKSLPNDLLINWLESLQEIYGDSPFTLSSKTNQDSLSIVLEFQEPN